MKLKFNLTSKNIENLQKITKVWLNKELPQLDIHFTKDAKIWDEDNITPYTSNNTHIIDPDLPSNVFFNIRQFGLLHICHFVIFQLDLFIFINIDPTQSVINASIDNTNFGKYITHNSNDTEWHFISYADQSHLSHEWIPGPVKNTEYTEKEEY